MEFGGLHLLFRKANPDGPSRPACILRQAQPAAFLCWLGDCLCSIGRRFRKVLSTLGGSSERPRRHGRPHHSERPTFRRLGCEPDDAACAQ